MSERVSFAHLPSRSLIALGGEDWRSFLQGLITQDVETLAGGEARFGALLTPQGRLLYDLFVVANGDGAWLDVEAAHRDALVMRLTMYRLRAKVTIAADETPVSVLFDPEAQTLAPPPPAPSPQGGGASTSTAAPCWLAWAPSRPPPPRPRRPGPIRWPG